jgi:hypothetical protein
MRILIWATHFGADLWAIARALESRAVSVRVALPEPRAFAAQAVAHLFPLMTRPVAATLARSLLGAPCFRPDVTVFDHLPPWRAPSRRGFVLWHRAGERSPDGLSQRSTLWRRLAWTFGDPRRPSRNLRWGCLGPTDLAHQTTAGGLHPANCVTVGAPSHDHLRVPFEKERARAFYPFELSGRTTVLLASADGTPLAHWGDPEELLDRLLDHLGRRNANVILRLPDRATLSPAAVSRTRAHLRRHAHLLLKFADSHPDDLVDMQVSDLLLTDTTPAAIRFLATGRPIVHLCTTRAPGVDRELFHEGASNRLAHDFRALLRHVDAALSGPEACSIEARAILDRHLLGADGRACDRLTASLETLCAT